MSLNRRELCEFLQERLGLPWADAWQRSKVLLSDRYIPAGGRGRAGGTDMEPKHAAFLLVGILSGTPVIEAARIARHFTDSVTRGEPVEIEIDAATIGECGAQAAAEAGRKLIGRARAGLLDEMAHRVGEVGKPEPGRYRIAPAGGFVDALAFLISMGGTGPGVFPWAAIRSVGVTTFVEGGWLAGIQFRAAVPRQALGVESSSQGELFLADMGEATGEFLAGRRAPFADEAGARRFRCGSELSTSREMPAWVLRDIGMALADELSARNANGSPAGTGEPFEEATTHATDATVGAATSGSKATSEAGSMQPDLGVRRVVASSEKGRSTHARQRGGGAAQRRNAAAQ